MRRYRSDSQEVARYCLPCLTLVCGTRASLDAAKQAGSRDLWPHGNGLQVPSTELSTPPRWQDRQTTSSFSTSQ